MHNDTPKHGNSTQREGVSSVADTLLAMGDTPERRALVNAYALEQLEIRRLITEGFNRQEATGKQRSEQMYSLTADVKLTLQRMHRMASLTQALIVKIDDQALALTLVDERLITVEDNAYNAQQAAADLAHEMAAIKDRLDKAGL